MAKDKVSCSICGKRVGYTFTLGKGAKGIQYLHFNDGIVCGECLFKAGMSFGTNNQEDNLVFTPKRKY